MADTALNHIILPALDHHTLDHPAAAHPAVLAAAGPRPAAACSRGALIARSASEGFTFSRVPTHRPIWIRARLPSIPFEFITPYRRMIRIILPVVCLIRSTPLFHQMELIAIVGLDRFQLARPPHYRSLRRMRVSRWSPAGFSQAVESAFRLGGAPRAPVPL